jgi:3-oxoacyl-[acyl-carrier protein] reductase
LDALKKVVDLLDKRVEQKIELFQVDLGRPLEVDGLLLSIASAFPSINALVNNAAIHGPVGPLVMNDMKLWKEAIQVDLLSPVLLCKGLIPLIKNAGGGSILNIAGGGATGPRENFSAYATAKAGLVRFGETLAKELVADNIRVNSISPGAMKTSLLEEVLDCDPQLTGVREREIASKVFEFGGASLQNVSELAIFLSSNAGKCITGKIISAVWDNWREWPNYIDELNNSDLYTLRRISGKDRGILWGDK